MRHTGWHSDCSRVVSPVSPHDSVSEQKLGRPVVIRIRTPRTSPTPTQRVPHAAAVCSASHQTAQAAHPEYRSRPTISRIVVPPAPFTPHLSGLPWFTSHRATPQHPTPSRSGPAPAQVRPAIACDERATAPRSRKDAASRSNQWYLVRCWRCLDSASPHHRQRKRNDQLCSISCHRRYGASSPCCCWRSTRCCWRPCC